MVMTHVVNDQNLLHVSYYETTKSKEGVIELSLKDPQDGAKVQRDDVIDIERVEEIVPGSCCTVVLHHANGATDVVEATCIR